MGFDTTKIAMLLNLNEVFRKPETMEQYLQDLAIFTSDWEKRKLELDLVDSYKTHYKVLAPIDVVNLVDKSKYNPPFYDHFESRMWGHNTIQMCN